MVSRHETGTLDSDKIIIKGCLSRRHVSLTWIYACFALCLTVLNVKASRCFQPGEGPSSANGSNGPFSALDFMEILSQAKSVLYLNQHTIR